jgi:hypothetical protein
MGNYICGDFGHDSLGRSLTKWCDTHHIALRKDQECNFCAESEAESAIIAAELKRLHRFISSSRPTSEQMYDDAGARRPFWEGFNAALNLLKSELDKREG